VQLAVCPEPGGDLAAAVGDLLATGRRFWRQKPEALAGPFQNFLGMSLADWIAARVGENWSVDKFQTGLQRSLSQGRFPITLVVNELDPATKETLDYLRHMNLPVRALGYTCQTCGGDELVWPRALAEEEPEPEVQPPRAQSRPSQLQSGPQVAMRPQPAPAAAAPGREESTPTVTISPQRPEQAGFGPLPVSDATPKQREALNRLVQLDGLGLERKGFEYYVADSGQKEPTAAVVLAVDPDRWPFPKPDEVIVVVNTDPEHMAGFLGIAPKEVEEFLGSLPRADRKERKGSLLLRAANLNEAAQIVNELRALKEVTAAGPS
jgi:hypothetical protein